MFHVNLQGCSWNKTFWHLLATGIALERTRPRNKMQLAGWTCFEGKKTQVSLGSYESMEFLCSIQGEHRWWLPVGQQKTSWNLGVEKVLGNYRNGSAMISAPVVEFRVRIQSIHPGKAQKKDKGTTILWATLNKVIAIYVGYSQLSTTCWFGV